MPKVQPTQWKAQRGRPRKTVETLPGQTSFNDPKPDPKLELVSTQIIMSKEDLLKAVKEHKFLQHKIKSRIKALWKAVTELERPVKEEVQSMKNTSDMLLHNIQQYASDNMSEFHHLNENDLVVNLDGFDIIIEQKTKIIIKQNTEDSLDAEPV